jgi:hypothetical protein
MTALSPGYQPGLFYLTQSGINLVGRREVALTKWAGKEGAPGVK